MIMEMWSDAGRAGELKGLHRGKEEILIRQMKRKFEDITPQTLERLDQLAAEQLDDLSESLLDFASFAEVELWLAAH